jgi:hypothetical protein
VPADIQMSILALKSLIISSINLASSTLIIHSDNTKAVMAYIKYSNGVIAIRSNPLRATTAII